MRTLLPALVALLLTLSAQATEPPPDANALILSAERAWAAAEQGVTAQVSVSATEKGVPRTLELQVEARGENARVEILSPAKEAGQVLLINGERLWFWEPGLRRPVPISPQRALAGVVSIGDVMFTRLSETYTAGTATSQTLGGAATWVVPLTARSATAPYPMVKVWITQDTQLPVRLELADKGGRTLKITEIAYGPPLTVGAETRPFPSTVTITDPQDPNARATLTWRTPKVVTLPDARFDPASLVVVTQP